MFESKVPGMRRFIVASAGTRYRCDQCGYISFSSSDDRPLCPYDNTTMASETASIAERLANIRAERAKLARTDSTPTAGR